MKFYSKKQTIHLGKDQRIEDVIELSAGHTCLVAPTGTGKTTYVMKALAHEKQVVFLCPMVAQVRQLEVDYQDDPNWMFCYGGNGDEEKIGKWLDKGNSLAMTYDQLQRYQHKNLENAVLVIDEAHKICSIGSYRDKAVQPILQVIKAKKFEYVLFMTATLTDHLFNEIESSVVNYYRIKPSVISKRSITLKHYVDPKNLSFYKEVETKFLANKKAGIQALTLVRINDIKSAKVIKRMLENKGAKVMLINREEMGNKSCDDVLKNSRLDTSYDFIFCTSILDEAINLTNSDDEIDSIHFVGQHAHPEEIVQFIGRTRKANPPVTIHLQQKMETCSITTNDYHFDCLEEQRISYGKMINYLNRVKDLVSSDKIKDLGELVSDRFDQTKLLNGLTNELFRVRGFWLYNHTLQLNTSNLIARLYQLDTRKCYGNINYLMFRIKLLLPAAVIKTHYHDQPTCKTTLEEFELAKKDMKGQRLEAIPKVMQKLVDGIRKNFKSYQKMAEILGADEEHRLPFSKEEDPVHHELFNEGLLLGHCVDNLQDAQEILMQDKTLSIGKLSYEYRQNPIVRAVMQRLGSFLKDESRLNATYSYLEINGLMNKWLRPLATQKSIIELLKAEKKHRYVEIRVDGQLCFKNGEAINFLKRYSNVKVFNDKKPMAQKKVKFISLCISGYSFIAVPASIKLSIKDCKIIKLNDIEYDARSGNRYIEVN